MGRMSAFNRARDKKQKNIKRQTDWCSLFTVATVSITQDQEVTGKTYDKESPQPTKEFSYTSEYHRR